MNMELVNVYVKNIIVSTEKFGSKNLVRKGFSTKSNKLMIYCFKQYSDAIR